MKLVVALFFSFNALYLVTCAFIMLQPENINKIDDQDSDTHRVESAVIVNSLVIGVLGLMLAARFFSWIGERMVEMLYQLIHTDIESGFENQQVAYQRIVNMSENGSLNSNSSMQQKKPSLNVPSTTLLYSSR